MDSSSDMIEAFPSAMTEARYLNQEARLGEVTGDDLQMWPMPPPICNRYQRPSLWTEVFWGTHVDHGLSNSPIETTVQNRSHSFPPEVEPSSFLARYIRYSANLNFLHSFSGHCQNSMASDEPGPGQQYAIQARKHIAALRRARPGITIEIHWCPAHKGIAGNETADEWAKIAAGQPGTRGVEWPNYGHEGRSEVCAMPLPRSLANLKREISEKKWTEARSWAGGASLRRSTACQRA